MASRGPQETPTYAHTGRYTHVCIYKQIDGLKLEFLRAREGLLGPQAQLWDECGVCPVRSTCCQSLPLRYLPWRREGQRDGWMVGANPKIGHLEALCAGGVTFLLDEDSEVLGAHCEGIFFCSFSTSCGSLGSCIGKLLVFTPS